MQLMNSQGDKFSLATSLNLLNLGERQKVEQLSQEEMTVQEIVNKKLLFSVICKLDFCLLDKQKGGDAN